MSSDDAEMVRSLSSVEREITRRVVETVLPDDPALSDGQRVDVCRAVCDFVYAEVAALPPHLLLPYRAALIGFDLLPLLRYGRRFSQLDADRRGRYLTSWSQAPLAVSRNFIKLMRSCALLAFFDHPQVVGAMHSPMIVLAAKSSGSVPEVVDE